MCQFMVGELLHPLLWNQWRFDLRLNRYQVIRYTTLDNESTQALDPYGLLDASLSKQFFTETNAFTTSCRRL